MNGKSKAKTAAEYLNELEEPRKKELKTLHALIRKNAPNLKPFMIAGMIGYGPYHYKYASGREGDWSWIGLASQKNYISLYICGTHETGYLAPEYKKDLPKAKIGKGCITFKRLEDIDQKVIEGMMKRIAKLAGKSKN